MTFRYPVYQPYLTGAEKTLVMDCLDTTWISSKGAYINQFEREFAAHIGAERALSVSNGTVAIHVALAALGIGPGDEVLVPTLTYVASANAVAYTGATPVFVDSEPDWWQIDLRDAERKITPRTKAIMPVHLYGHPCDMDGVLELARRHGLLVVEDCAEALGTRWKGRHVGTFGDVATFSFFGNKTITTGEGGMVVTNSTDTADLIQRLKGQGLAQGREYFHDLIGYNYRMTNICAAIGCAQMRQLPFILERKRDLALWYAEALKGLPLRVHGEAPGALNSYWMVSILVDDAQDRTPLREALREGGIETRPVFVPVHEMPMYRIDNPSFPVAANLSARGMNLPSYPALERSDVAEIAGVVRRFFSNAARDGR
jgi:perosamine synthetase